MFALPADSPPVIVLVATLCGTLVGLATAFVHAMKYLMPNDSGDRVKLWSLWLRYCHRYRPARSDRCRAWCLPQTRFSRIVVVCMAAPIVSVRAASGCDVKGCGLGLCALQG